MTSVFRTFDCRYNPESSFWQSIPSKSNENLVESAIFAGELRMQKANGNLKNRKIILTSTSVYYMSKWNIPKKKASISWKQVEPFIENEEKSLKYGFRISGHNYQDFYTQNSKDLDSWIAKLSQVGVLTSFEEDLVVIKEIAKGTGTLVRLCHSVETPYEYSVKTVDKKSLTDSPELLQSLYNEISALRVIQHPNIVKLYKVYETASEVHMVFEYIPNGDLFTHIVNSKKRSEEQTLMFMKKLIDTISYLHSMDYTHRDIKLENIVLFGKDICDFKIIDFGLACSYKDGLIQKCGSPGFIAPEILRGKVYDCKADLFSAGVLMYILLSGTSLFQGRNAKEVLENNKKCKINYPKIYFKGISKDCVDLLNKLLASDPSQRINAFDALGHSCIKKVSGSDCVNSGIVLESIEGYDKATTCESIVKYSLVVKPRSNSIYSNYIY